MNVRERFLATMAFEPVDRPLRWEGGYWGETLRTWCRQNAPLAGKREGINLETAEVDEPRGAWDPLSEAMFDDLPLEPGAEGALQFDPAPRRIPLNSFICPCYQYEILEQHGDTIIARDERGHLRRERRGGVSIAQILRPLVTNRQDWEQVKAERLRLDLVGRLPSDWPAVRKRLKNRDYVLTLGGHSGLCGFYHPARYLMGPEGLLCAFYDQPDLVKDILNHLADLQVFLFDRVLGEVEADMCFACEDLGYKTASFISPAMFREFILPCYMKLTGMLRDHGLTNIIVDSDGDNWPLLPLFLEGGATGMVPMEVAAGMDVVEVRKVFPRLQMIGGIDKRNIAAGGMSLEQELAEKVPRLLRPGGYIPFCDGAVPPDVSWERFCHYRRRLTQLLGESAAGAG